MAEELNAIFPELFSLLRDGCRQEQSSVYLVGGAVRDLLLNRPAHDLDFVTPGNVRQLGKRVAHALGGAFYMMDEERQIARVICNRAGGERMVLDFSWLRGGLPEDLLGRDFTINAMAVEVQTPGRLIDPLGGLADLRAGVLRACAPTSMQDDSVRVLRGVRQSLAFQFRILPETAAQMRAVSDWGRVSPERLRDEVFRILEGRRVATAVRLLDRLGALGVVFPELETLKGVTQSAPHVTADVWEHTLAVAQHLERLYDVLVNEYSQEKSASMALGSASLVLGRYREQWRAYFNGEDAPGRSRRALLFLAALYHDVGKPATRLVTPEGRTRFLGHDALGAAQTAARARALMLSVAEVQHLEVMVRNHLRIHLLAKGDGHVSRPTVYRFFRACGAAGVDLCLLALADVCGVYGVALPQALWQAELQVCRSLLEAWWEKPEEAVRPPRLLGGSEVMALLGLAPGPQVGQVLEAIQEAQACGLVADRPEAEQFARQWLADHLSEED